MHNKWFYILLFTSFWSFSQNETNIWYFGENAGLDFNSGTPTPLLDGALNTEEGCATISDPVGNLLFYTDGNSVYNRNHILMQNGNGLNGATSSTHSAIIVPNPNNSNIFYIFTVDDQVQSNGLQYSEVDMTLDGGLGGITATKNILLETPITEKLTAIKSGTTNEYWVVSHKWESNEFISYRITGAGVNTTPVISAVGSFVGSPNSGQYIGQIKISPDGTKIAVARFRGMSEAQLFDFDSTTGIISNPITLMDLANNFSVYGVEFSPNSKVLYIGVTYNGVFQFNLEAGSTTGIINSITEVSPNSAPYGSLQLAKDGKIYIAKEDEFYLDVIDNPDIVGLGCDYQFEQLYLDGRRSKLGLPPFIQSFFIVGFEFEDLCEGYDTNFNANLSQGYDTILWDFGDGNISTDENPMHTYILAGDYDVTLTVTLNGNTSVDTQTITIYEQPTATQPMNMRICDTNNDGFSTFDLSSQDVDILNGQDASIFEVVYFANMTDYTNRNAIANPTVYSNQVTYAQETIIASVRNRNNNDCEAMTTFTIQVFESPMPSINITEIVTCDNTSFGTDDDGFVLFDLTQRETDILNGQATANFTVSYFTDVAMTNQIANPAAYQNTSSPQTIYVEMFNNANTDCIASTSFNIEVFALPTVTPIVELRQCDDDLDGFSLFNLNEAIGEITTNSANETITFHESQLEADNNIGVITNVTAYQNQTVSTDAIWARVENANNCFRTSQVNLIVSTTQIPNTYTRDFYECDDGTDTTDGIATFDFTSVNTEIEALFPTGQQLIIAYYRNQADALSETNPIVDIANYQNIGYPNTQQVFIRVDSALDNDCLGLGHHINLNVETVPVANPVTIDDECDDDGDTMYAFDTSNVETTLLNGQTGVTVIYTDVNGMVLPSPLPNPFLTSSQTITARVENSTSQDAEGACYDETNIEFTVEAAAVANTITDLIVCDDDNDGSFNFDTSAIEATVLGTQTGMTVTYRDGNGNLLPSPLPNPFTSSDQMITVRVENPLNVICFDETSFNLTVVEQPMLDMQDVWAICEGEDVELIADEGYDEYLWSTGEMTRIITVDAIGTYQVTATNINGSLRCEDTKSVTVVQSNIATITDIETVDWTENDNEIIVNVNGNGDYEYSLDGIDYQDSNQFSNLPIDDYTVYVRDKNGCGITTEEVFLLYYPKYFTPNNDGYHDTWQLKNTGRELGNVIYIYDRYGKLLKQLSASSQGWDGTFNGKRMPTSDYWFVVNRENGKQYKGHFALKN